MSLEPLVVGSIKDCVVCSVWALGDLATPVNLGQSVKCNSSVLAIAIEGLIRDGYMRLTEEGWYDLDEELAATLKPSERKEAALVTWSDDKRNTAIATQAFVDKLNSHPKIALIASQRSTGDAAMAMKVCKKCEVEKAATVENFGSDSRTEDGLGKTCADCKYASASKLKPRQSAEPKPQKRSKAAPRVVASDLVIPAAGFIACSFIDDSGPPTVRFSQYDDQIICSIEQLQVLRDWADGVIKKAMAA